MRLLIDAGNSAVKWAVEERGRLSGQGRAPHCAGEARRGGADAIAGDAGRFADGLFGDVSGVVDSAWAANVAGSATEMELRNAVARRFQLELGFARVRPDEFGLTVAYTQPQQLGVDRWLAMIAGIGRGAGPLIIADLGTALTLDAVDEGGRHLGGLIAPGRQLMCESLIAGTSDIAVGAADATLPEIFAADTAAAVGAGAAHSVLALVGHARAELARRLGQYVGLMVTGGDGPLIAAAIPDCEHVPDLVLRGLARYAADS